MAETLMAVTILLLVSTIVATGIPVAKNAYEKVVLTANAQTLLSTAVNALRDEIGTAWDVRLDDTAGKTGNGTFLTYNSADTGARTKLSVAEGVIVIEEKAAYNELGVATLNKSRPLVSDSGKLQVSFTDIDLSADGKTVTIKGLAVSVKGSSSGDALASLSELEIRVF